VSRAALLGCGARNELLVDSGTTSGGTSTGHGSSPSLAHFQASCAPNDGPAILLILDGTTSCAPSPTPIGTLQFLVWGADLTSVGPGSTLTISGGGNALRRATGWSMSARPRCLRP
jgi:hypothetical protein